MEKSKKIYFVAAFAVLFCGSMIVHIIINNTECPFDAYIYWTLGQECGWNVKNIPDGFRGYVLPYIFSMCYKFGMMTGREFLGYWILSSFALAFTFTFSFYHIAKLLKFELSDKYVCVGGVICGVIFWIFFRGVLIYTLSDFYAFSISLFSIILLNFILQYKQKLYIKGLEAFGLGLCLYGTYNIRTIYVFLLLACLFLLVVWQLYKKRWIEMIITLTACLGGLGVCAVPQMLVNYNLQGIYSWKVPTEGLMLEQLKWGVWMERYATYIGDLSEFEGPAMHFVDNIGMNIINSMEKADLWTGFSSYKEFIGLIFSHPLDFAGIYMRHLLNMLYPVYPDLYIQDIVKDKSILLILFYTILFIAISNFINSFRIKGGKWVWLCFILLSCICILPGAVEIRFFISMHFIIYMYAVLGIKDFWVRSIKCKVKFVVTYVLGILIYIAYAGAMLSTTMGGIAIINP